MTREELHRQMVELSLKHIEKSLLMRDHQMSLLEAKVDAITEALRCTESRFIKSHPGNSPRGQLKNQCLQQYTLSALIFSG